MPDVTAHPKEVFLCLLHDETFTLQVLIADSDRFTHPLAEPWARLIQLVQQTGGYSHVVAASGSFGKNIVPRAAALLDVSPVTDVTEIPEPQQFVRQVCLQVHFLSKC